VSTDADKLAHAGKGVVWYTSSSCGLCKSLVGTVKSMCQKYSIDFVEIDILKESSNIAELGIMSIPAIVYYNNKKPVLKMTPKSNEDVYRFFSDIMKL